MKTLYLMWSRVRQYFRNNRLLFLLFFLGGALNAVMVVYGYGNLLPMVSQRNSTDWDRREYYIRFDESEPDMETVKAFAENPLVHSCAYVVEEGFRTCDPEYPLTRLSGSLDFTEPYQAIVTYSINPTGVNIGDRVEFCGKAFTVIGVATDFYGGNLYIPYDTFLELGCGERITRINLFSAQRQEPGNDQVLKLIEETFPEATYFGGVATNYARDDIRFTVFTLCVILVNAFLAVLAYLFLLRYIIDSQMTENLVSVIVGASRGRLTVYIFWETLLLSVTANGVGLLLHWALYRSVFSKLNISAELSYRTEDYFFVYLMLVALSLATTIPFVLKYLKLSPIAARREHSM